MSQKNDNFFESKKEWSKTKDAILGCYLKPYFQKLIAFGKPICYVDCFAGKGMFDDGNQGSPLIALDCINNSMQSSNYETDIYSYFIELNHHTDLSNNVASHLREIGNRRIRYEIVPGRFEENIDNILNLHHSSTVFLYVDPYGIKAIDVDKFNSFRLSEKKSVEMLINYNTWGFFREACRVLKADFKLDNDTNKYLVEYDPNNDLDRDELCTIAGGDYWIEIVTEYKNKCASAQNQKDKNKYANEAELKLSKGIASAFNKKYKYVLNVPIKSSDNNNVPKYRLFHLTNHEEGCLLMADNMYKRIEEATVIHRGGQMSLFDLDTEGEIVEDTDVKSTIFSTLLNRQEHLNEFLCRFYTVNGLLMDSKGIKKELKNMELLGQIEIVRVPSLTGTGKKSNFMEEKRNKSVFVRRV